MQYEFLLERQQEVDAELAHMQAYLQDLAQEIRDKTAPHNLYNHTWLQADNAIAYIRSLRVALQSEQEGYKKYAPMGSG